MAGESTFLLIGAGLLLIFGLWASRRAQRAAVEHAHASGYYAGVIDARLATSDNHSLSDHPRPWADDRWYLLYCAGAVEMYDEAKAVHGEMGDTEFDP